MRRLLSFAFCVTLILAAGCRSQQLACDQDKMRCEVLNLYTNQVMDNLIRTEQGFPIVQMDYTNITGTVTQNGTTGINDGYTSTYTNTLAGVVQTITHTFTNVFTFNASGYETAVLTVREDPLITNNEVYMAYIRFVKQTPSPLVKTCDPPPPGAAHMCRKSSGVYYWIPTAYKEQFFNLALATTVMRPAAPPDYFANTVVDAQPISANGTKSRTAVKFGTAMQNGAGQMEVVINGVARRFPLYTYQAPLDVPNPPGATIPLPGLTAGPPGAAAPPAGATAGAASPTAARPGDNTVWFEVMYDQKDVPVPPDQFLAAMKAGNVPAKVYLDFFKPASALTQTVKAIQDDTTQLRTQGATH